MICKFLCVPFLIKAQGPAFHDADSLAGAGNFALAAVEYERVIFEAPGTALAAEAALRKAGCLSKTGRYEDAASTLDEVSTTGLPDTTRYALLFRSLFYEYLAHEPAEAYQKLVVLAHFYPDSAGNRDLLMLKILSLNEMQRWKEADTVYRHFMAAYSGAHAVPANPYLEIPRLKDPDKAEKLSAYLPFTGAGLFYAGDVWEGILNVALQGGFIAFGAYSVLMERYITGVLIGVGGYAAFYHGGVRRAKRLVELRNERVTLDFNTRVRQVLTAQ